jgi:aspartyl-tRNA synthetase
MVSSLATRATPMTYRVIDLTTQELIAELHERELAIAFARQLAADHDFSERFGVVEVVLVYETTIREGQQE